jgi:hypothetical protein
MPGGVGWYAFARQVCAAVDGSIALYVRNLTGWNLQHEFREHTAKVGVFVCCLLASRRRAV